MIKAVIFDLDDTLVKTYVVKWAQHKAVAKDFYGRELSEEKLREHWGKPFNQLVAALHDNADTVENMLAAYASNADRFPKELHDDTVHTLDALLEKGLKLGIVTATNRNLLVKDLKRLGIPLEKFAYMQAADDTDFHKPDPRVFEPILAKLSEQAIEKNEVMYVGDALTDLYAARDAGLQFVAIPTGLHSKEEFEAAGANTILNRLGELPAIIS